MKHPLRAALRGTVALYATVASGAAGAHAGHSADPRHLHPPLSLESLLQSLSSDPGAAIAAGVAAVVAAGIVVWSSRR